MNLNKVKINPEFEKLPLKNLFIYSLILSTITLSFGLLAQIVLPPQIPLLYGLPQTNDQLVSSLMIILPSIISIFITIINAIFSIKSHDNYLKKILAFTTISIAVLSSITIFKIIFLVSSI